MQEEVLTGSVSKMKVKLDATTNQAQYYFVIDNKISSKKINDHLNKQIAIEFLGNINCIGCNRTIKKTFNQGYCFPCFRKLASCDSCIMSPYKCHYHLGTCREPEWGLSHCMQNHYVYLANSSGLKVGLTRENQIPIRWIDQGAKQALIIAKTKSRYQAGLLEKICAEHVADKTNWREMLKGTSKEIDLLDQREILFKKISEDFNFLINKYSDYVSINIKKLDEQEITWLKDESITEICYPVTQYPDKIKSLNLDKTPTISGELLGIKGQYLILDIGVLNIRKYTGYKVKIII